MEQSLKQTCKELRKKHSKRNSPGIAEAIMHTQSIIRARAEPQERTDLETNGTASLVALTTSNNIYLKESPAEM